MKDSFESLKAYDVTLRFRDGMVGEDWLLKGDGLFHVLASGERDVVIFSMSSDSGEPHPQRR